MAKKDAPFDQNVIALIWDFDKTLICEYMQRPLFEHYEIDAKVFWNEVNNLEEYYKKQNIRINSDAIYLNHILTYVQEGKFKGLNNHTLKELGKDLKFYPGLPEFFTTIKDVVANDPEYSKFNISVEHYIVSTGFTEMIKGSAIAPLVEEIWGCEFIERPAHSGYNLSEPVPEHSDITQVAVAVDNTTKTRAIFEINKGVNKFESIDVNSKMKSGDRRIPFEHMIYIADGPSDIPAFSIINEFNGLTYAVYANGDSKGFNQVDNLRKEMRIDMFGEANYTLNSPTYMWLVENTKHIANKLVIKKELAIMESVSAPPKHLS